MIEITQVSARVVAVRTRLPFRYGIAEMTAAPHVVIEVEIAGDSGAPRRGWASEQLPPKWFTKDPSTTFAEDLTALVAVVEHAAASARGLRARTAFDLWHALDDRQMRWALRERIPGLLAGLGTALIERAVIDAACRLSGLPFTAALRDGALGFAPELLHPELATIAWRDGLAAEPASAIAVRHTVGFADALTDAAAVDRPGDGLPVSLESVLRTDGVDHLKVKTAGDADADLERLRGIFEVCDRAGVRPRMTIDGNESMRDAGHLRRWSARLLDDEDLGPRLRESLLAIEQPVHRDSAATPELSGALAELSGRGIAVIIDESDSDATAVRRALDLGYAGGTYKGCKGVFRGLANAVLVAHRSTSERPMIMTAEDLATLPPLTVAQDLVVAATMGLTHIERNGHHYFGRLAPLSPNIAEKALGAHPDLYRPAEHVGARLRVTGGALSFASALAAPFGFAPELDVSSLPELSLEAARAAI